MRTPFEVAESYWAAECRRDIEAVMAHYHPDATYQDAGGLLRGHAEIRTFYEESKRAYPGLEVRIIREFHAESPDCSALQVEAVLIDAEGKRFGIKGLNVATVSDGKLVSLRCFEDPLTPE